MNELTKTAVENFRKKGFSAEFFESGEEALEYVLNEIGASDVGIGGSMTISELGWFEALEKRGRAIWHWLKKYDGILEEENAAPCYITSANAVSAGGAIINIDANGNRVAAAGFGAKKVFIVCGENKITPDMPSALFRAKNIAAPLNAKRLGKKTPCAIKADKCYNCASPERICRITSITDFPIQKMQTHIIFIKGSWGY